MKKTLILTVGAVSTMVLMSGCATIINGKTQVVDVTSGTKKTFNIDGQEYTTPAKVHLHRDKDNKEITVDGCSEKVTLKSEMNPAVLGNILFGGLPGTTTDLATGSGWKYDDEVSLDNCK